ncbi:hypothetical protein RUM43_005404 [Polyplax serrata]|uniref:Cytochrome b5 heme-binding domain-containing protein n=1 Tax=Polyplax serrata TaxID=468196 RepID=A0AAN8NR50_POLSC
MISTKTSKTLLFTSDELKSYNGEKGSKGTYLSILGDVYDVSKGQRHYGPGGPYHVFAGRDASRSFVTGNFDSDTQVDDVLDLSNNELLSLRDWSKFYKKEYDYKGKLIGRFYDNEGKRTEYWENLEEKFNDAEKSKQNKMNDELLFPPCNVEWNAETGTKVWCSKKSGGIERNWAGVPRKLYMVGSESYRCACIDINEIQNSESPQYARRGHLKTYEHCDPLQYMCFVKE